MRRRLVRDRVTLASVAVLAVGLGVLGVATNLLLTQQLGQDASALLRERTDAQLATIAISHGRMQVRAVDDGSLDRQSWAYSGGKAIERPVAPPELQRAADDLSRVRAPVERTLGERTRLRATPVYAADGSGVGTVVVGTSLDPYEHSERIARVATAMLSLLVLALGAFVARRAVGAALRPVADMAASAAEWSEHDLERRLDRGPPRDELTSLAATLDDLLGRIDAARRHEQRFSNEMAHELRTPLSGVRAEAELALGSHGLPRAARESLETILVACDRMASAIETLLMSARAPSARGSSDPAAAVSDVAAAAGRSRPRAGRPGARAAARQRDLARHVARAALDGGPQGACHDRGRRRRRRAPGRRPRGPLRAGREHARRRRTGPSARPAAGAILRRRRRRGGHRGGRPLRASAPRNAVVVGAFLICQAASTRRGRSGSVQVTLPILIP